MEVFIDVSVQSILVINVEETRDLYLFGCSICLFVNKWRCEDIDQIILHGDSFFSLSAFSSSEVPGKRKFYPTLARLFREKREKGVKKTNFASKAAYLPHANQCLHTPCH